MATTISDADLARIAQISRLKPSIEEAEALRKDLNSLLEYFSKINEIESKGSELHYVKKMDGAQRKDEPLEPAAAPAMRSQFAKEKDGFMMAPKSL